MTNSIYKPREDCQIEGLAEIYEKYFGNKTDGSFVEIGAWDCISYSNTWFLAELGWNGMYVDPVKEMLQKGIDQYNGKGNVYFVNTGIGAKREARLFKRNTDAPWLYTGNEKFGQVNCVNEEYGEVQLITLNELFGSFGSMFFHLDAYNIDLLIIDVEGMELEVLAGFTVGMWNPKMIIIETHELHPNSDMRANASEITEYFINNGYEKVWTSAINSIFVKK